MKIGAFAKSFDVSVDTVRYYIEIELLLPDKKASAQYEFTPSCVEDMAFISEMKQFHFTLQEIRQMLLRKRISDFTVFEDIRWHYLRMMNEKKQRLMKDKEQLENALHQLENKLITLQDEPRTEAETGVPYSFLPLLYCPSCRIPLQIRNAFLQGKYMLSAQLYCSCSYRAEIKDGILLTSDKENARSAYTYGYEHERFQLLSSAFINLTEKGNQWLADRLRSEPAKHQLIVEANADVYTVLPRYISSLPPETMYIFCGTSSELLIRLKEKLSQNHTDLQALYIESSDWQLPLAPVTVDLIVDSFSFNDFSLHNRIFPLLPMLTYLKPGARVLGHYLYYQPPAASLSRICHLFPQAHERTYHPNYLDENFSRVGMELTERELLGYTKEPGSYLRYHVHNEKLHLLAYLAEYRDSGDRPNLFVQ
ncbi:MerR family transcriptional regulator [Paenibacillus popilliae]|nr:MerR family transcriptional regulator [Paenibacillus sp. SDF0028]